MKVIKSFEEISHYKADITIIMPAYNAENTILKAISSIISQTFSNFVLVIVDDASTDDTWHTIKSISDDRVIGLRLANNKGHLTIRNEIFHHATSPFITFQDADDWSHEKRLEHLHTTLQNNPELVMCGTWCFNIFSSREQLKKYPLSHSEIIKSLEKGATNNYCSASVMFRRILIDSIGVYDHLFEEIGSADIDWQTRVTEQFKTLNLSLPLYYYRQHSESFSKRRKHVSSHLSSDIAYFCHLLRNNKIAYHSDKLLSFIEQQYQPSDRNVRDKFWIKKIIVWLYEILPFKVVSYLVAFRRKKLTAKWLGNYNP